MLILATTRPQAVHPEPWTALARGSTLRVGALDESEARALLGSVLLGDGVSDAARAAVLERSAGNPLYAIEFARMLAEGGGTAAGAETPASVQAVIAARLDAVPADDPLARARRGRARRRGVAAGAREPARRPG